MYLSPGLLYAVYFNLGNSKFNMSQKLAVNCAVSLFNCPPVTVRVNSSNCSNVSGCHCFIVNKVGFMLSNALLMY